MTNRNHDSLPPLPHNRSKTQLTLLDEFRKSRFSSSRFSKRSNAAVVEW